MNKNLLKASVIAIIVIGTLIGAYLYNSLSKRPQFSTTQVSKGDIAEVLDASGKIKPENTADLGFEIGGRITALNYKVGDAVKKGVILARSNDVDLQAQYSSALSEVKSANATLKKLEETKEKDKFMLKALKTPNDTSNDKNAQREQIDADKAAVDAQASQVTSLEAQTQSAASEIEKTIIRAPYDGIISKQDVEVGETAVSDTPIMTVINGKEFKIEIFVSEIDAKKIQVGNTAKITLDSNPGVEYSAKVTEIDPAETLTNNVSSYKITLNFDQINSVLVSGTDANAHIELAKKSDILIIPKDAVFQENNKNYVYVSKNGLRTKQEVGLGITGDNGMVEILSGISEGDTIFQVK